MERNRRMKNRTGSIIIILIISIFYSCKNDVEKIQLKEGFWRAEIAMQERTLPFNFEIFKDSENYKAILINSKENIPLDEVEIKGDSVIITLHIFDI